MSDLRHGAGAADRGGGCRTQSRTCRYDPALLDRPRARLARVPAGDRLFSFTRLDPSQWKSARTTNAIERLNEEFRRRIKTQTVLPCAETVPMLLWALLASGQIQLRKIDGWETLAHPLEPMALDLAA